MANPLYPDVPNLPGVPAVFRAPDAVDNVPIVVTALRSDAPEAQSKKATWGVYYSDGTLALAVDSVISAEPMREYRLSDYITEKGGFQTYNKVETPAETRVTVTKGGDDSEREAFLNVLDNLIEGLELLSFVMPDGTLTNRTLIRYDYRRGREQGATLLTVELMLQEVRETAQSAFTDSKAPEGNDPTQGGPVQSQPAAITDLPPPSSPVNPVLVDLPQISSLPTAPERAALVTQMVGLGASINDLAAKGASFLKIPALAATAQSLTTTLAGQSVKIDMAQKATGLFASVYLNDALVIGSVLVQNDNPIVRSQYLGFAGELFFHDTQSGLGDIAYGDLAGRVALLFAGA